LTPFKIATEYPEITEKKLRGLGVLCSLNGGSPLQIATEYPEITRRKKL